MALRFEWVALGLLVVVFYGVSGAFANYWPLGLLQAGFVAVSPLLLARRRFGLLIAAVVFSLVLGSVWAFADFQFVWSWRVLVYGLVHVLWLAALANWSGYLRAELLARVAVVVFLLAVPLINFGDISENQQAIAFLEVLLCAAIVIALGWRACWAKRLWLWVLGVCMTLCASNIATALDGVGLQDWWRVIQILAHFALGVILWAWAGEDERAGMWVWVSVQLAVAAYIVAFLLAWFSLADPVAYDWFFNPPLFQHIRHVGYFFCVAVLVGAWGFLAVQGRMRLLAWLGYLLALTILLWSGGRGAILAAFAGVLVLAAMRWRHEKAAWLYLLAGLPIALAVSALFAVDQPGVGWLSAILRSDNASSLNELSSSRLAIWMNLWDFIVQRPWLGWGGEAFHAVTDYHLDQAHNVVVQLLLEWGVVGSLVLGGPMFALWVLHMLRRQNLLVPGNELNALGVGVVVTLLALSLVDGVFYHGLPSAYLALGYAAMCARRKVASQSSVG